MLNIKNLGDCTGCGACASICPTRCITMVTDSEGFKYPSIDTAKCINCDLCTKTCLYNMTETISSREPFKSFGVINLDDKLRGKSSSGGVFALFAEYIITKNGVVYGASFTDGFKQVKHIGITNIEEIQKLQGSKYVQSDTDGIYHDVLKKLNLGVPVLFTGTPCQIAGLKGFLKKEYSNLICIEVICHGVPSPKVWEKYIDSFTKKWNTDITDVQFRNKEGKQFKSKGRSSMKISGSNNNFYECLNAFDPYNNLFLSNICLRPSCYQCTLKGNKHLGDIVIADFWGADKVVPGFGKEGDISLVICFNNKGLDFFNKIKVRTTFKEVDSMLALKGNQSFYKSCNMPEKREYFFTDLESKSIRELGAKYANPGLKKKIIVFLDNCGILMFLKKILRK